MQWIRKYISIDFRFGRVTGEFESTVVRTVNTAEDDTGFTISEEKAFAFQLDDFTPEEIQVLTQTKQIIDAKVSGASPLPSV